MPPKHTGPNRTLDILNNLAEQDFLNPEAVRNLRETGVRVERISIALIRPDAAQPRGVMRALRQFAAQEDAHAHVKQQVHSAARTASCSSAKAAAYCIDCSISARSRSG